MHPPSRQNTTFTGLSGGQEALFAAPHRFSFNGQERTDEIAGTGNHTTALYWEYDTRLGRRWNRDPVVNAWLSSYATFYNNPIYYNDPSGAVAEGPCEGSPTVTTFPDVVITAKAPSKFGRFLRGIGDFFSKVGEGLKELGTQTAIFASGASNAWASNQLLGAGRGNPQDFGPYAGTAQAGQTFGDIASIVTGAGEVVLGAGKVVAGVTLDATGIGAIIGVPLNVAGVATAVHGSMVIGTATANMIEDGVNRTHDNMHGNPSSSGGNSTSAGQMQKKVERGQAPKSVDRVDKGRAYKEQDNIHFKDGHALNKDGIWKHGGRKLTNEERKFLQDNGWGTPK